jgi:hypothetical protein
MKTKRNRAEARRLAGRLLALTMMMAVTIGCFTSCSKDDGDDVSKSLAGTTWQYVYSKTSTSSFYLQLDFISETGGTIKTVMSANGIVTDATQPFNFTYEYDGVYGTLDWGGSEPLEFTVSGNKLAFDKNTAVAVGTIPLGSTVFAKK